MITKSHRPVLSSLRPRSSGLQPLAPPLDPASTSLAPSWPFQAPSWRRRRGCCLGRRHGRAGRSRLPLQNPQTAGGTAHSGCPGNQERAVRGIGESWGHVTVEKGQLLRAPQGSSRLGTWLKQSQPTCDLDPCLHLHTSRRGGVLPSSPKC